ncbi:MAG: CDP-diacylglycerol--serine O-phosphatidyltransferase [Cyclobacteriaceae bacterium]|nr:CDP-diacylglycerol--serine O-phosphatidyltransferase [Cyclobacteriaceae bacterium]
MKSLAQHIPNVLTLSNLLCGCIGILLAREFPLYVPAYLVWLACVFDFFDGFAARMLKTTSSIGKELDSLADMVSFGVLPSMVMFTWLEKSAPGTYIPYIAFLIALFSALRLAKFNVDENQTDSFIGLPTPANALFITGLVFLDTPFNFITSSTTSLAVISILFSLLLVAPLDLFALKFKNFGWSDNKLKFTFIGLSVLLLGWKQAEAVPLIILLYIILSLGTRVFARK